MPTRRIALQGGESHVGLPRLEPGHRGLRRAHAGRDLRLRQAQVDARTARARRSSPSPLRHLPEARETASGAAGPRRGPRRGALALGAPGSARAVTCRHRLAPMLSKMISLNRDTVNGCPYQDPPTRSPAGRHADVETCPYDPVVIPTVLDQSARGRASLRHLLAAAAGTDRVPRPGGRRPDRQPHRRRDPLPRGRGPRARTSPLHQLPGRPGLRRAWPSTT